MQRSHRRFAGLLALSLLMATGVAACGDDDSATDTTSTTSARAQGSPVVSIEMTDFAYSVSGPLTAGGSLRISNTGKEFHMLGVGRLKPGKTLADLQKALAESPGGPGGEETGPTTTAAGATTTTARGATTTTVAGATTTTAAGATTNTTGRQGGEGGGEQANPMAEFIEELGFPGNIMSPGQTVEVSVPNLTPGTYALICFIPTEGSGAPHVAMGMINQLEVVTGAAPPEPTSDATYRLAPDKAIEGPATLTAGRHTLRFEAAPGSQQLEPGLPLLNPGTSLPQFVQSLDTLFESEEGPPPGAAAQVPGQVVFSGFDLEDVTSFYLTVDLKPGNYYIVANDTDVENPPSPPVELLNVTVS